MYIVRDMGVDSLETQLRVYFHGNICCCREGMIVPQGCYDTQRRVWQLSLRPVYTVVMVNTRKCA